MSDSPQAAGGVARAASLSPERRSEIASIAAKARRGRPSGPRAAALPRWELTDHELELLDLSLEFLGGRLAYEGGTSSPAHKVARTFTDRRILELRQKLALARGEPEK